MVEQVTGPATRTITVFPQLSAGQAPQWNGGGWSPSSGGATSNARDLRSAVTGTDASPVTIGTPTTDGIFLICASFTDGGSPSSGTDTYKVTWTDWAGNARNITLSATAAANLTQQGVCVAQVKANTNIQVQITAIGSGSSLNIGTTAVQQG